MSTALKVRKGDEVEVISGKDRGKRGTVQEVHPATRRVIVAGLNIVKRHRKANPARNLKGGIIEQPGALDVAKVMVVCPKCSEPTRVGHEITEEGEKRRVCKNCGEPIVASGERS